MIARGQNLLTLATIITLRRIIAHDDPTTALAWLDDLTTSQLTLAGIDPTTINDTVADLAEQLRTYAPREPEPNET